MPTNKLVDAYREFLTDLTSLNIEIYKLPKRHTTACCPRCDSPYGCFCPVIPEGVSDDDQRHSEARL